MGEGQCEWCGVRIYCRRARWFGEEKGYILQCLACGPPAL